MASRACASRRRPHGRDIACRRRQRVGHRRNPGNNLAAQVIAVIVDSINRDCRPGVHDQARGLNFGPGAHHGHPAIHAHEARLCVAVGDTPTLAFRMREAHVAIAMRTDDTGQARGKRRTRNITHEDLVDASRNLRRQYLQALVAYPLLRDVPGTPDFAIPEHAPLDARITDIHEQRAHTSGSPAPVMTTVPDVTLCNVPNPESTSNAPSSPMPAPTPSTL